MSRLHWLLVVASAVAGCTANIDGTAERPGGTSGSNPDSPGSAGSTSTTPPVVDPNQPPTAQVACASTDAQTIGHRALRRLTNAELEATIRATFGLDATAWTGVNLPSDAGSHDGFTNNVDSLTVSPDYAKGTLDGAKKLATQISGDALLSKLAPCASAGDRACAETFVSALGTKLYRRPLSPSEKTRYLALYDKITAKEDFKSFAYWAVTAMLQSPNLIYRSEVGEPDGSGHFKLTAHEIATELAYAFTGGPPSATLTELAAANQLSTPEQIEAAARALVFDGQAVKPAFRDVVLHFANQWLGLGGLSNLKKDAVLYPDFSADVQESMAEETRRFFSAVVLEEKGNVQSLLTAPYTYVDSALAQYYGFGAASGGDFARVTRPANWGVGLLAQGSLLAVQANSLTTSPTRRGYLVRTKLLCGVVPPPPAVVGPIPEPTATQTTRQRYELVHEANPSCGGCHALMDHIGFALEHLDSAGRYRETENSFAIDDSGTVSGTSQGDVKIKGASELATTLSKLPEVSDCVSSYVAAYTLGVNHESAACLVSDAASELRGGKSLLDFYVGIARSPHFRSRQ
ncbi:MAG TPA: DUF1592 domain-containing protein [Polyangiaceae bacterium]|nr:DUF1592 domain-containing protein [Polyangiaceae bacterium]